MLPETMLFPSNARRLHEKFESAGVIRDTFPLYLMKVDGVYHKIPGRFAFMKQNCISVVTDTSTH